LVKTPELDASATLNEQSTAQKVEAETKPFNLVDHAKPIEVGATKTTRKPKGVGKKETEEADSPEKRRKE
jgi:hypothetical protein